MNDKQRNKLNMYVNVRDFLLASAIITDTLVVFAALFASFQDYILEIMAVSEQQERDNTGVAAVKGTKKVNLINKLMAIAKRCEGFASGIEDTVFENKVALTRSRLELMADADLVKKAEDLITLVTPRLPEMVAYKVTGSDLEALLLLKDEFFAIYNQPISDIEATAALTAKLEALYKKADANLVRIDKEVGIVFDTEPEFYANYLRKRALVKLARRIRALQFWVKDDETGLPVVKAKVTIKQKYGTEMTKSVKSTGKGGGIAKNNMEVNEYIYEVEFGGYIKENGSFFINEGVMTTVVVRLKRSV
jgi:hypothetical protein